MITNQNVIKMVTYMRPDTKSDIKIADLEKFNSNIIKAHQLYYYQYKMMHGNKLVFTANIWWSGRYQRFVATGTTELRTSFTVADDDYKQLIKKIYEAAING